MYPESFYTQFGVGPNILSMQVRCHLYLGDEAFKVADALVLQAMAGAYEEVISRMDRDRKAELHRASQPKFGMSRGQRKAFFRDNPTLASAPLGVSQIIQEHEAGLLDPADHVGETPEGFEPGLLFQDQPDSNLLNHDYSEIETRVAAHIIANPEEYPDAPLPPTTSEQ